MLLPGDKTIAVHTKLLTQHSISLNTTISIIKYLLPRIVYAERVVTEFKWMVRKIFSEVTYEVGSDEHRGISQLKEETEKKHLH